jgi:hypothetical protein
MKKVFALIFSLILVSLLLGYSIPGKKIISPDEALRSSLSAKIDSLFISYSDYIRFIEYERAAYKDTLKMYRYADSVFFNIELRKVQNKIDSIVALAGGYK